ncbi:MAG: hypothetical protein ABSA23_11590 [Anaerolineales bacterium]|jgi:hypothetical protein
MVLTNRNNPSVPFVVVSKLIPSGLLGVVLENASDVFVGIVPVVSHDRHFLDRTVKRFLELENGRVKEYFGGDCYYVDMKGRREQVIS